MEINAVCKVMLQPCSMLQSHVGHILLQLGDSLQTFYTPCHHIHGRGMAQFDLQTCEKQTATDPEILSHILNKGIQISIT